MYEKTTYKNTMHLKRIITYVEDDKVYLKLSYTYEGDDGIHEVTFPKIDLGFYTEQIPNVEKCSPWGSAPRIGNYYGDSFTLRSAKIPESETPVYFFDKLIRPAVKEMTLEEIEKKLGYPIKIVNKKGEQ